METRRLEYFIRIVDFRSITKAAAQIGVAQPALSQQLAILENEFKTKLLHRSAQGVEPTSAGLDLYRHARVILRQLEQAHDVAQSSATAPNGPVSVGFPISTALLLSMPFLETMRERFPRVTLHITEGLSGHLSELAINARLDVALLFQAHASAGLVVEPMWTEDLLLIAPADAELPDPIGIEEAAQLPLIMPARGHGARMVLDAALARHGLNPTFVAEIDSNATLNRAVQKGHGFSFLPWTAVYHELAEGRLRAVAVDVPHLYRTVSLCRASSLPLTRPMESAMRVLREHIVNLLGSKAIRGMRPAA
ncbi:LysR substrate-binding domain-containing protein [Variovorax sp. LjRoot290]|uniref:LysR substrate-binding domain-containing protein n=1 Tax=Variovorax sp. LjRoot290 TaxID=3342316 RepID=UPI003ECE1169